MELIHTLGIAIDSSAAKSGSVQAAAAFQQVGQAARATGAAAQIATKAMGPVGIALGVVQKALSSIDFEGMITGLYETSTSLDKLQRHLKTASSGSDDFRENLGFLRGVAKELGLDFVSTGEAFAKFATAAKGKLSGNQIRDTFLAVNEASVAMGLSTAQTSDALKSLSDMLGKGAVKADDLRGQLSEKLPGAFTLLAQSMGLSEASLTKVLDTGGIMADELVPKLAKALHEAMGPGAAEGAKSLEAEMNRLKNSWMEVQALIMGEGGDSIFGNALRVAREALEGFKDWLAALFEANEEGDLSDAVAAAFRVGLGMAVNYFAGFVRTAAQLLGVLGKKLLDPEQFFLLTEEFIAVALTFGVALLEAVKKPLAYVQAFFERGMDFLKNPKLANAHGQAQEEVLKNDERFKGMTLSTLRTWAGWFSRSKAQDALLAQFNEAVSKRETEILRENGDLTIEERVQRNAGSDPLAGAKDTIKKTADLFTIRVAKSMTDTLTEATAVLKDFGEVHLIDYSADVEKKNELLGRAKSKWAPTPSSPRFSGEATPTRTRNLLPNLPPDLFSAPGSFISEPLTLSREPSVPSEPAPEPTPSLFSRFRQGLQQGTEGFTDDVQQMQTAGAETARALTSDFADFFTSSIEGTKSLGAAFRDMAASILRDIERILVHRLIAEPIVGVITHTLGLPTTKSHHGGLVGAGGGMSTLVNPLLFLGAPRLHSGLAPDEFPAILQRGERVVPKSQAGAWDRGGGDININVNVDGSRGGTPAQNKAFGAEVARQIEAMVDARIARAAMPRGILRPAASYA